MAELLLGRLPLVARRPLDRVRTRSAACASKQKKIRGLGAMLCFQYRKGINNGFTYEINHGGSSHRRPYRMPDRPSVGIHIPCQRSTCDCCRSAVATRNVDAQTAPRSDAVAGDTRRAVVRARRALVKITYYCRYLNSGSAFKASFVAPGRTVFGPTWVNCCPGIATRRPITP